MDSVISITCHLVISNIFVCFFYGTDETHETHLSKVHSVLQASLQMPWMLIFF